MSRFVKPTKYIGFDLDSVESWKTYPADPNVRFMEKTCLEIGFKSGEKVKLYGEIAELVDNLLTDSALKLHE